MGSAANRSCRRFCEVVQMAEKKKSTTKKPVTKKQEAKKEAPVKQEVKKQPPAAPPRRSHGLVCSSATAVPISQGRWISRQYRNTQALFPVLHTLTTTSTCAPHPGRARLTRRSRTKN